MLPNKKLIRTKWFAVIMVVAMTLLMLGGCGKKVGPAAAVSSTPTVLPDSVVEATYKGGEITKADLQTFLNITMLFNSDQTQYANDPSYQGYLLQQIAVLHVLNSLATEDDKKVAEVQVQKQMTELNGYSGTKKTNLDAQLKSINVTLSDIEAFLRTTLTAMQHIDAQVTDSQVQAAYDANIKSDPNYYVSGTVDHILIATVDLSDPSLKTAKRTPAQALAIAKDVKSQLDKGGDFAALAQKYSDDTSSSSNGGNLGNALLGTYDPAFRKAALSLPIGQVSDPILISYGYDLLKVESRSMNTFDDMKASIRSVLEGKLFGDFVANDFPAYNFKSKLPLPSMPPNSTVAPLSATQPSALPTATASGGY